MRLRVLEITKHLLILSAVATAKYGGDEMVVPLDGGSLLVGADFHPTTELAYKILHPESQVYDLVYSIKNQTPSRWTTVRLRFDIGGLCEGKPKQWSIPIVVDNLPPHNEEWPHVERGTRSVSASRKNIGLGGETVLQLREDPAGCSVEIINVVLRSAERNGATFDRAPGAEDMSTKLRAIQAAR